jgi:rare lipoprotein A
LFLTFQLVTDSLGSTSTGLSVSDFVALDLFQVGTLVSQPRLNTDKINGDHNMTGWRAITLAGLICGPTGLAMGAAPPPDSPEAKQEAAHLDQMPAVTPHGKAQVDASGRKEKGRASFYAHQFANRKMADGHRMDPNSDVAASKTLPLGSVAKVTNLDNGKSATVRIEDRGPFVDGRVVDLAPKVANQLDINKKGVAPVEVKPITVPQPEGGVKLGAGGAEASPGEIHEATEVSKQLGGPAVGDAVAR